MLAAAVLAVGVTAVSIAPAGASPYNHTLANRVRAEAAYASRHHYRAGLAVIDRKTGIYYAAGHYRSVFASESVVKVFIFTGLAIRHHLHGHIRSEATYMVEHSSDRLADRLYGLAGGDRLVHMLATRYHIHDLGSRPVRRTWWGSTRVTPLGLAQFYAKVAKDRTVAGPLLYAMRHTERYASDGTYQLFGIPSATRNWAVKQGWGNDLYFRNTDMDDTGFAGAGYRYVVVSLIHGRGGYRIVGRALSHIARVVIPGLPR